MSMKKTDIEKHKATKLREGVQKAPVPARFGVVSTAVPDRREQRRVTAGVEHYVDRLVERECRSPRCEHQGQDGYTDNAQGDEIF